jgi:hypothetical protein
MLIDAINHMVGWIVLLLLELVANAEALDTVPVSAPVELEEEGSPPWEEEDSRVCA